MPIKNLTDETLGARLPRLGKLRKGGEKTAKGYGPDLDHFRFTSDNPKIEQAFTAAFGDKPSDIIIYLPYAKMDDNFQSWCEVWSKSGLEHRCDGETAFIWRDGDQIRKGRKACPGGHKDNDAKNDAVARLEFVIPQLWAAGYVGTVALETHSIHDIVTIAGVIKGVYEKSADVGGIAFRLYRQQEEISVPGFGEMKGKRQRIKKWLVKISPAAEWVLRELQRAKAEALQSSQLVIESTGDIVPQIESPKSELPEPTQSRAPKKLTYSEALAHYSEKEKCTYLTTPIPELEKRAAKFNTNTVTRALARKALEYRLAADVVVKGKRLDELTVDQLTIIADGHFQSTDAAKIVLEYKLELAEAENARQDTLPDQGLETPKEE